MKEASKTGWAKKVKEVKQKIEESELEHEGYRKKVEQTQAKLDGAKSTLAAADQRILAIKPAMRLDSLEDRCESVCWELCG